MTTMNVVLDTDDEPAEFEAHGIDITVGETTFRLHAAEGGGLEVRIETGRDSIGTRFQAPNVAILSAVRA